MSALNSIAVVGGVYREMCVHPRWDAYVGSGGRAASALSEMGVAVELHAYADAHARSCFAEQAALADIKVHFTPIVATPSFHYFHGLSIPSIRERLPINPALKVSASNVLRFGMIEGDAVVRAVRAVFDPQDATSPLTFAANGSSADHLALVLNRHEAQLLLKCKSGQMSDEDIARAIADLQRADVVVMKRGPQGALVFDQGHVGYVPAYQTQRVWKIGSGDNFAAHFAAGWMHDGLSPVEAAARASLATAYFCEHGGTFASRSELQSYKPVPVVVGPTWREGRRPTVYLAGPFFNLSQLWLVEQARTALIDMGVHVFSPYHDVGHGSARDVVDKDLAAIRDADLMLALMDGLDPGTIYEVGYARAIGRPVVVYSECVTVEDRKMMEGSDCSITSDFVSAVYRTVWEATRG